MGTATGTRGYTGSSKALGNRRTNKNNFKTITSLPAHEPTNRMEAGEIDIQSHFSRFPRLSNFSHPEIPRRGSPGLGRGAVGCSSPQCPCRTSHRLGVHSGTRCSSLVVGSTEAEGPYSPIRSEPHLCSRTEEESFSIKDLDSLTRDATIR